MANQLDNLVEMTRTLGDPQNDYVVIGEGNTSMRLDAESFAVKASGQQMHNIDAGGFVSVYLEPILGLLDHPPSSMSEQKAITRSARLDQSSGRNPSIEVSFHAMLLHECGVKYIGHTHPTAINQVLCTEHADAFARQRRFPDEVVLCGPQSLLAPYGDPGLPLALIMRHHLRQFLDRYGEAPKLILLQNHGMIALGDTPGEILNITAMAVKAAKIFSGALQLGKATHLPHEEVQHLYKRPDEIYRRQLFVEDRKTH
ncbi:MAG: class II aldolase/adducin family protein [Chloroflexi bacterium]|nr:class II aldolase/adducin family protein [Chloroflexota bacterium]